LARISFLHVRDLFSFSVWLTFCQAINNLNWMLDTLLIVKFLGPTALGVYSIGNRFASMPTCEFTQPLGGTFLPTLSKIRENPKHLRRAYQRAQTLMTAIALPLGMGMAITGDLLIPLVLGEKWMPALLVVQVIAIVAAMQTLATLAQALAMATGD